jgi:hypothetical protein
MGFKRAGFPTALSHSMDGWLKTHAVFVTSVSAALALEGGDSVRLGQNCARVTLLVNAIREGFAALQSLDISVMPFNLKLMISWMPRWFAVRYWQHTLQTSVGGHWRLLPTPTWRGRKWAWLPVKFWNCCRHPRYTPSLRSLLAALTEPALAPNDPPLGRA